MTFRKIGLALAPLLTLLAGVSRAAEVPKPHSAPCVEREELFEFTQKPACRREGDDRYEITFAVKGHCDVTVSIVDPKGVVVRHLAAGVLGQNAPPPFQKSSLSQKLFWNGKDDLDVYPKEPEKLSVRVQLGLKPVFDKRLGGTSPYNLPGYVCGLAVGPEGACVILKEFSPGFQHATIRSFDRDGNYRATLIPPPAQMPEAKLGGMGFVEYESGKRALQGPDITQSINHNACYLPPLDGETVMWCQPALVGNRLFFANTGKAMGSPGSLLYYTYTDGSTDVRGLAGVPLAKNVFHNRPSLCPSPDGKRLYFLAGTAGTSTHTHPVPGTCVYVTAVDGPGPATVWIGDATKPGSDDLHFGDAVALDTDSEGRVYVADMVNSRIQIFSPEGKHLKTIPIDRPGQIRVHRQSGALYVGHTARVEGRSVGRITKLASWSDPKEVYHRDGVSGVMALDSWSPKPRLWVATLVPGSDRNTGVTIWEEGENRIEKIRDFEAEARKEPGWFMKWQCLGSLGGSKSVCDPLRERLYYSNSRIFDLVSGKYEGALRHPGSTDDIAFDKRGYLHAHFNPCFYMQGVGRFDPQRAAPGQGKDSGVLTYRECPYDYGIEKGDRQGVLPVKDQNGAKGFQDGLGVTMDGEVAVQTNIYYVPKMEDEARSFALQGSEAVTASGIYNEEAGNYDRFLRSIKEAEKRGEETFSIRRSPGIDLSGGTVWTFERTGELRRECAVIAGDLVNGVQIDEDLAIYCVHSRPRLFQDKTFLSGQGGHFGIPASKQWVFTGTCIKTKPDAACRVLKKKSTIPLDPRPSRPAELAAIDFPNDQRDNPDLFCWIEGAEWLYAGVSPITNVGCSCPASRLHLDWFKRVYVPEAYRHSVRILDTHGNPIVRFGRYGNFDTAPGAPQGAKSGETDLGVLSPRYLGGTDNYLAFEDWGERLIILKLAYHAEETVGIK